MYKIRGGDGKEYGPVSAETLRDWVNQGRASAQTYVLSEGGTEWKMLSALPEFAAHFAPPLTDLPGAAVQPPVGHAKTSGMAIASLVSGILGFATCGLLVLLTAPLGLILGLGSLSQIKKSEGRLGGRGLALAGTIVSGVSLILIPLFAAMLLPAIAKAKAKAQSIQCMNNMRQIGLSVRLYSGDNNDKFPAATNWCDATLSYAGTPKLFVCNGAPTLTSGYAFNAKLSGLNESKIDPNTVVIFESDAGWNASGGRELMITKPRHGNGYIVGFADGHCETVTQARILQLRWDPNPAVSNNPTP